MSADLGRRSGCGGPFGRPDYGRRFAAFFSWYHAFFGVFGFSGEVSEIYLLLDCEYLYPRPRGAIMPPLLAKTGCSVSEMEVFRCKKMRLGVEV